MLSGLDWAVMSGGDAGPLGAGAASELHSLFKWASRSRRGLLLFVDEAEAALADRGRQLSENAVSALNAFLYHTSEPSTSLVLVLATNRPGDLDKAVLDRVDDVIHLPLPTEHLRLELLRLEFRKIFFSKSNVEIRIDVERELAALAEKTPGFSGRELAKLVASVRGAVLGSDRLVLDSPAWEAALAWKLAEIRPRRWK